MATETEVRTEHLDEQQPQQVRSAFQRLVRLLERAALGAQVRGLHSGLREVEQLLARKPAAPVLQLDTWFL